MVIAVTWLHMSLTDALEFLCHSYDVHVTPFSVSSLLIVIIRGLDVQPTQSNKFARSGDADSVSILDIVYREEITHVAAGLKWFSYICEHSQPKQVRSR